MLRFDLQPRWWGVALSASLILVFSAFQPVAKPLITPKGSFSLNGVNSITTLRFSRLLGGFEKQFGQLTDFSPGDAPPVIVVLNEASDTGNKLNGDAILRVDALDRSLLRIQVDVPVAALDNPTTSTTLAQALLLRHYYNGVAPLSGSLIAEFPPWLLHGLGRLSNPEAKLMTIPSFYLHGAAPPSIPDLLVQKAPDSSNSALLDVYDTMAADLLTAGFKGSGGMQAFHSWIGNFDPNAPTHPLSSWPPGWSMQSVERRWLLLMADNGGEEPGVVSILSIAETLSRYDKLRAEIMTPDHSLLPLKKQKGGGYLLDQISSRLTALRLQGNPLVDPLLEENIRLCAKLNHLSAKKILEKEKKIALQREDVIKRSRAIDAYMDWFEASKLPVRSGLFEHILGSPDSPVQKGPIGRYLDTVESRGW